MKWRTEKGMFDRQMLIESKKNFILNAKAQLGCDKCTITHPSILVLHHVNGPPIVRGVRQRTGFNWSHYGWPKIMEELKKCTVLCLNHHGLEHEKINS